MGIGVSVKVEIEIKTERGTANFSKIIFFFFGRYNISVGIIGDFIIIISSASEISILKVDLIRY